MLMSTIAGRLQLPIIRQLGEEGTADLSAGGVMRRADEVPQYSGPYGLHALADAALNQKSQAQSASTTGYTDPSIATTSPTWITSDYTTLADSSEGNKAQAASKKTSTRFMSGYTVLGGSLIRTAPSVAQLSKRSRGAEKVSEPKVRSLPKRGRDSRAGASSRPTKITPSRWLKDMTSGSMGKIPDQQFQAAFEAES